MPPAAHTGAADPLAEAIAAGIASGHARRRMSRQHNAELLYIRDKARASGDRAAAIDALLGIVQQYPAVEAPQKIVARLLNEIHDERALHAWSGIARRFPNSMDAFRTMVALTHRQEGPAAAGVLIRARFPRMPARYRQLVAYAHACELVGFVAEAGSAFNRLWQLSTRRAKLRRLLPWGNRDSARVARGSKSETPIASRRSLSQSPSVVVLEALFEQALTARPTVLQRERREQAPVVLLVGSLGSGGAERQVVTTAVGLAARGEESRSPCGDLVPRPVRVLARSLRDRPDGAFFLPDLERAGITTSCYRDLPDFNDQPDASVVRPLHKALKLLPWSIAEATIKTTDLLRALDPEVVHIWQDGLIYAAGLAALLAGVPRIVLSPRSVPQPERRPDYPPEYDVIYRSILRAPGVALAVNSRHAANRYAEWLDIDCDEITVIANGVSLGSAIPDAASEDMFKKFNTRTVASTLTLGTVMRLDTNKRPLLWIDAAAHLLRAVPTARFIVVGDGPLREATLRRAAAHSILDRVLFVGRSSCVSYWLSKMTAFLLLSEHEGLPNVLIEAQLAGIPIVATPAGGAAETLVPNVTGIVTSVSPTAAEVAAIVADLAAVPGRLREMGIAAQAWARETFPVDLMIDRTLDLYRAVGVSAYGSASHSLRLV
jgi:glycosyltransferase involved in cell wall biosynthesis